MTNYADSENSTRGPITFSSDNVVDTIEPKGM
jgi:hypothetical protein